jgi:hypothetical protein
MRDSVEICCSRSTSPGKTSTWTLMWGWCISDIPSIIEGGDPGSRSCDPWVIDNLENSQLLFFALRPDLCSRLSTNHTEVLQQTLDDIFEDSKH